MLFRSGVLITGYNQNIIQSFDDKKTLLNLPELIKKARKLGEVKNLGENPVIIFSLGKSINEDATIVDDIQKWTIFISEDFKTLDVKMMKERNPNVLIIDDEFEWLDIDYNKLEIRKNFVCKNQ